MRNRNERFNWQSMGASEQRNTLRLCRQRYIRMLKAKANESVEAGEDNPQQGLF